MSAAFPLRLRQVVHLNIFLCPGCRVDCQVCIESRKKKPKKKGQFRPQVVCQQLLFLSVDRFLFIYLNSFGAGVLVRERATRRGAESDSLLSRFPQFSHSPVVVSHSHCPALKQTKSRREMGMEETCNVSFPLRLLCSTLATNPFFRLLTASNCGRWKV